jgi:hypothetical protein
MRSLLVVGLGGGTTLETVPATGERIDVVEIEPALAAVPPLHPLAQDAMRLRVEWRVASGDRARSRPSRSRITRSGGTVVPATSC